MFIALTNLLHSSIRSYSASSSPYPLCLSLLIYFLHSSIKMSQQVVTNGPVADGQPDPKHRMQFNIIWPKTDTIKRIDFKQLFKDYPSAGHLQIEQEKSFLARDAKAAAAVRPVLVDWRIRNGVNYLCRIVNQESGNCWAFASTACLESMIRIEHGYWAKRSEGDLRDGSSIGWVIDDDLPNSAQYNSEGGTYAWELDWSLKNGIADYSCVPWVRDSKDWRPTRDRSGRITRFPAWQDLPLDDQKDWLNTTGPIVAHIVGHDDWGYGKPGTDVFHVPKNAPPANWGHVVLVVGYDDNRQCW